MLNQHTMRLAGLSLTNVGVPLVAGVAGGLDGPGQVDDGVRAREPPGQVGGRVGDVDDVELGLRPGELWESPDQPQHRVHGGLGLQCGETLVSRLPVAPVTTMRMGHSLPARRWAGTGILNRPGG